MSESPMPVAPPVAPPAPTRPWNRAIILVLLGVSRGTGLSLVIGVGLVGGVLIPMIGMFVGYIASFHGPCYTVPPGLDDRDYDVVVQNNFRYGHEDFVYQVWYGGPVTFERLGVLTARLDECTGRCIPTVETAADGTQSLILAGDRVELP